MPIPTRSLASVLLAGCFLFGGGSSWAQEGGSRSKRAAPEVKTPAEPPSDLKTPTPDEITEIVDAGLTAILGMEEGQARGEWPYQGVYRVRGKIPVGYRVGGTAICCLAMTHHPEFGEREEMREAVERGIKFIVRATKYELMSYEDYEGGYDVRGWGYIYAVMLLADLERRGLVSEELRERVAEARGFYLRGIASIEIPETGGWNYARSAGRDSAGRASPFMTSSALQALFAARAAGFEVDAELVERGLGALEGTLFESGESIYAGVGEGKDGKGGWPGATGRTASARTTLFLAGRSTEAEVRQVLDGFIEHWKWLEARRAKPGTHMKPYGVAPYYFFFAHHAAAQAVMCLPEEERASYRDRINALLLHVRNDEVATWNDRVFERSANYGTAMACLALMMERVGLPAAWEEDEGG